jgi:hypothetical protein
MEGRQPNRRGESLTPRQKRVFAVIGVIVAVLLVGVGAWAASDPGTYGRSRNGCINVTVPSSTGGAIMHDCGASARAQCRKAFSHTDKLSLAARPACRQAGLAPS